MSDRLNGGPLGKWHSIVKLVCKRVRIIFNGSAFFFLQNNCHKSDKLATHPTIGLCMLTSFWKCSHMVQGHGHTVSGNVPTHCATMYLALGTTW